jgi:hypothetical protein
MKHIIRYASILGGIFFSQMILRDEDHTSGADAFVSIPGASCDAATQSDACGHVRRRGAIQKGRCFG